MTKRASAFAVVFWSQMAGIIAIAASYPLFDDGVYSFAAVLWGAGAGIAGGIGVILLYRGLATGRMSIVAPITAVEAASVPVLFGFFIGERPGALALVGVVLALLAVFLVSSSQGHPDETVAGSPPRRSGVPEAIAAGLMFGLFFILLDQAGDDSGIWPLVGGRVTALSISLFGGLAFRESLRPPPETRAGIVAAGWLDVAANVCFLLATRTGLISLAAVLTSMYPATTVLCARLVLKERVHLQQGVGLGLAAAAVVAIAYG